MVGLLGVPRAQLRSYERVLARLIVGHPRTRSVVADLEVDVSWPNRLRLWWLPYLLQVLVASFVGLAFQDWVAGVAFVVGMTSHPIQGWLVNGFGHSYGYRSFATDDNSRNNHLVSFVTLGEGYQNNHHADPSAVCFSRKFPEVDVGYCIIKLLRRTRLVSLPAPA
jgi:stearoyl-CoA desaturase (delta-9 desaturase)